LSIELVKEDIHTYKQDVINVTLKDILVWKNRLFNNIHI
jgi:hypothetical protein